MSKRCYYDILGVERAADDQAIKGAFRRVAKECHPDLHAGNGAEERFKEANEAYEMLRDPNRRAAYDRFGHAAFDGSRGAAANGNAGFGADFSASMSDIFDDLFGDFMGGRRRGGGRGGRERGADQRVNLEITLREAYTGTKPTVDVSSSAVCAECDGSGAEPGSTPVTCTLCAGHGKVRASQGFFTLERTCERCDGRGEIIRNPCASCEGAGRVAQERRLQVRVPAGIEDGNRIRLPGEGHAGTRSGTAGDLYLFISVAPDPLFRRDGTDLYLVVPVPMVTAALGGHVEVPTLDGDRARVKIPEGTRSGTAFRLRGKGMPRLDSKATGDLYVEVSVETPVALSRKQRDLLKEFEKSSGDSTHPDHANFTKAAADFWDSTGQV